MSTIDTRINKIGSSSKSSSIFSGQLGIGNIINSAGSLFPSKKKSNVNNTSKTEILNQASSGIGSGNVNGSMLELDNKAKVGTAMTGAFAGLESSLPPGISITQAMTSNGMSDRSKVEAGMLSAFAGLESSLPGGIPLTQIFNSGEVPNISVNVTQDGNSSTNGSDKTQDKNSYSNPDFSKMTGVGLIEKKDSPVRIEVGDEKIDRFFLTSVNYEMKEKVQMMSMLDSSDIIYFFGDSPIIVSFTGICLDTYNYEWLKAMVDLYKNKMRGTLSVSKATKVKVSYDEEVVEGVVINMNVTKTASSLNNAELRFTMIITDTMSTALNASKDVTTGITAEDITTAANTNIANRATSWSPTDNYSLLKGGGSISDLIKTPTSVKPITATVPLINNSASKAMSLSEEGQLLLDSSSNSKENSLSEEGQLLLDSSSS